MKYAIIAAVVLVLGVGSFFLLGDSCEGATCSAAPAGSQTADVSVEQQAVSDMQAGKDVALIDVRTLEEWNEGHATGAILFELARIQNGEFPDVEKDKPLYVYCRSGNRSAQAAELLRNAGFTDVRDVGAFTAWQQAGGGVE